MKNYIVELNDISKYYKSEKALSDINLILDSGKIYGLLGQNGAGKTTLIRTLLGLSIPSDGEVILFSDSRQQGAIKHQNMIGSIVETPAIKGNMTAYENMKLFCLLHGIDDASIISELMSLVGLSETGNKKAKHFSLGMKQRLAIAIALLNAPTFLILDEPVNGLDPIGVVELRNLIINLWQERKITFLISSHNLSELHQVATDYILMHKGKIKQVISADELESQGYDTLENYFINTIIGGDKNA